MGLAAEVQGNVLLGDQAGADAGPQVFVQEASDLCGTYVPPRFEKATSEDGDCVRVRLYQVGHDLGEFDFLFERVNRVTGKREKGRQRMKIIVVDLADMRVGYDNVRKSTQRLDAVGQTGG